MNGPILFFFFCSEQATTAGCPGGGTDYYFKMSGHKPRSKYLLKDIHQAVTAPITVGSNHHPAYHYRFLY